ncbi:MAG: septation regulator SpoVG [Candidatus Scatosoma sp.]
MINITDVRIKVLETESKVRAIASITLDSCFVIHEIKVIDGKNGLFVIMPGKKAADGTFKDVAHPLDIDTRSMIQDVVLSAYRKANRTA